MELEYACVVATIKGGVSLMCIVNYRTPRKDTSDRFAT